MNEETMSRENKPPFFNVIIPVYNVAPYLRATLESVFSQVGVEYEVICVNDGSTDGSLEILREYEALLPNMVVIDQPNAGVSAARNAALDAAQGEYVTFMDGDDLYPDEGTLKLMRDKVVEHGVDILRGSFSTIGGEVAHVVDNDAPEEGHPALVRKAEAVALIGSVCRGCYRRSLIEKNKIRFKPIKIGEDNIFATELMLNTNKFYYTTQGLYVYRIRGNSASMYGSDERRKASSYLAYLSGFAELAQKHPKLQGHKAVVMACILCEMFKYACAAHQGWRRYVVVLAIRRVLRMPYFEQVEPLLSEKMGRQIRAFLAPWLAIVPTVKIFALVFRYKVLPSVPDDDNVLLGTYYN